MNYEEMSDNEINELVADLMGGYAGNVNGSETKVKVKDAATNGMFYMEVDYCNNPSDAWPIILESRINLISPIETRNAWTASNTKGGGNWNLNDFLVVHENPLRAAMIVFLMIQEQAK